VEEMPEVSGMDVKDIFMYALTLFERGEHGRDIKEKILFRVLHKKRYTESEAIYLIESSEVINPGRAVTKKDMRGLCTEYKS
jgi:AAA+ superfamily predicted ATPase